MRLLVVLLIPLLCLPLRAADLDDELGLTLYPAQGASDAPMVVFLSGDGGWAPLDRGVSQALQRHGLPVVGWSSLHYYWHAKTPALARADLIRLLRHYGPLWQRPRWLLIGFSFGAELVPFMIQGLPDDLRQQLVGAAMLSPSVTSDFEIHVSDLMRSHQGGRYNVLAAARAIHDVPLLCLQGRDDHSRDRLCPHLTQPNVTTLTLTGGHHFQDDYPLLTRTILQALHIEPTPP